MSLSNPACPLPPISHATIQLAHGSGGRRSQELVQKLFLPKFGNPILDLLDDQAVLPAQNGRLAFTTDSFVVSPIFFPGGDIGDLAINGTVNDLAMSGATPLYISAAFILEEGLPIEDLERILVSMEKAARKAGVRIVTGDTKVVNKGCCDRIFINTAGIGALEDGVAISASNIRPGDKLLLSGTVADHGMAVMTSRENLSFHSRIQSDTAPLNGLVRTMLAAAPGKIHALRDPTRGGLATTVNEFAATSRVGIKLDETPVPVRPEVRAACEVLGIDPLYVANEGKLLAAVAPEAATRVLAAMRQAPLGEQAVIIGTVVAEHPGMVTIKTPLGAERILDMPVGEQLPRIC